MPPGSTTAFGELPSSDGAAIAVLVAGEDGRGLANVLIDIIPEERVRPFIGAAHRQEPVAPFIRRQTDEVGAVFVHGVPPGHYFVRAVGKQPDQSFAFAGPFEVVEGDELDLGSLTLGDWISLEIAAVGNLEPLQGAEQVQISVMPDAGDEWFVPAMTTKVVDPAMPVATFERLPAGRWLSSLKRVNQGRVSVAAEVAEDLPSGRSHFVELRLDHMPASGQVLLEGVPVAAALSFYREDQEGTLPATHSDEEGKFSIFLDPDRYDVHVNAEGYRTLVPDVDFREQDGEVIIELPASRIRGVVKTPAGIPVDSASVHAIGLQVEGEGVAYGQYHLGTRVHDGAFVLPSVPAGSWKLVAGTRDGRSEPLTLEVGSSETISGIELVLKPFMPLEGRLVADDGQPIPGALIVAHPPAMYETHIPPEVHEYTSSDGSFAIQLESGTTGSVLVDVRATGYPVSVFRLPVNAGRRQPLVLPSIGGRLTLTRTDGEPWEIEDLHALVLSHAKGGALSIRQLMLRLQIGDLRSLVIPNLQPGNWRIGRFDLLETGNLRKWRNGQMHLPRGTSFALAPGESIHVALPAE